MTIKNPQIKHYITYRVRHYEMTNGVQVEVKYLCQTCVCPTRQKSTRDKFSVTCKNCLRKLNMKRTVVKNKSNKDVAIIYLSW